MEQETKNLISATDLFAKTNGFANFALGAVVTGNGLVGEQRQTFETAAPAVRREPKLRYDN